MTERLRTNYQDGTPSEIWSWRGSVLVLTIVATPLLAILALHPDQVGPQGLASVTGIVVYPVVLVAAALVYFHWRMSGGRVTAWLVATLAMTAAPGLAAAGLMLDDPVGFTRDPGWPLVLQMVTALCQLLAVRLAARRELRGDPFVTGLAVGLVLAAAGWELMSAAPPLALTPHQVAGLVVALAAVQFAAGCGVLRLSGLAPWVRLRLAAATALLAFGVDATFSSQTAAPVDLAAIVAAVLGAVVLGGTAIALLRLSIHEDQQQLHDLHCRVEEYEESVRAERARLHEIGSTVAGIASASRLIHDVADLSAPRRLRLSEMLDAETARLERLLARHEQPVVREVDLDQIIAQLAVSQEARGHQVRWEPSGLRLRARSDDVTELVHIVLDNAAKHGDAAGALVTVTRLAEAVEIAVSNTGPGVSPEARETLFEWGVRGPLSSGQGIGLHIAHRLATEQGGYLKHVDIPGVGTTFVIGLAAEVRHDALRQSA